MKNLHSQDLLDAQGQQRMLLGAITRNYSKVIGGYAEKLNVSKSSLSRAFQRSSKKELEAINH